MTQDQKRDKIYKCDYGLTNQEVVSLHEAQNYRCAACNDLIHLRFNRGVVDHCHVTNKVRGILCAPCNKALGHAYDSIDRLKGLIRYLENPR